MTHIVLRNSLSAYPMGPELVVDNTVELPVYNFQDIAACARKWADQLEAGEQGEPSRAVLVAVTDEGVTLSLWGENTSGYELIGLLEAAKQRAYDASLEDD